MAIKIGLAQIKDSPPSWLKGRRFGLLCHQASVLPQGLHARILLKELFPQGLKLLFSPQHGLFGERQANMISSEDVLDPETGLPVVSLYGPRLSPRPDHLAEIDLLLVDLQDVGCRVYTYIWTLLLTMEACARAGVEVVILDRPNPLGRKVEGPVLDPELVSFVGLLPLPMRHGLTVGELARYFQAQRGLDLKLRVVKLEGWHGELFPQTGLPWIMPSPNMPSFQTALVYPGQVLLEGTNLSEGRGTTRPFEIFGAPFLRIGPLRSSLPAQEGVWWREVSFVPVFDKWQGRMCRGFQIHVTRSDTYRPVGTTLLLLREIKALHEEFAWRRPPYEFTWQHLPFDIIVGTKKIRAALEAGAEKQELLRLCEEGVSKFCEEVFPFVIYKGYVI